MNTPDLKKKLIHEIKLSNNKNLLEELYNYLNQENDTQKIHELSKKQVEAIEEARLQIKNGHFLTNEQANQEIEAWLNK